MPGRSGSWRFGGKIGGGEYLLWGGLLFGIKFVIDRAVAGFVFDKRWTFIDMLAPALNVTALSGKSSDQWFYLTMLLIAVPFALVGIHLTLNRLRSTDLPRWLVVLFFVPVVNLLYFIVLACLPVAATRVSLSANAGEGDAGVAATEAGEGEVQKAGSSHAGIQLDYGIDDPGAHGWRRHLPADPTLSAVVVSCITAPVILGLTVLSVMTLKSYGLGLFVGMPFIIGLVSAVLHGQRQQRTLRQCLGVATISVIMAAATFVLFAVEGIICVLMMLPLAIPLALIGAVVGYSIQKRPALRGFSPRTIGMPLVVLPMLMTAEHLSHPVPAEFVETTIVQINAPPDVVWPHCVAIAQLPPPHDWLRAGVAYPVRTEIAAGGGVGARRLCVLSTGQMVECVDTWEPGRELRFSVTSTPPVMKEWGPWDIHPPHLENFMQVHAGAFRLIALPGGRTRVIGTSWYQHDIWPASYWRLWSDHIVHLVHRRVMHQVKALSEAEFTAPPSARSSAR